MEWNDNELDKLFKDAYSSQKSPDAAAGWQNMLAKLEGTVAAKTGGGVWHYAKWTASILVVAAMGAGMWFWSQKNIGLPSSMEVLEANEGISNTEEVKTLPISEIGNNKNTKENEGDLVNEKTWVATDHVDVSTPERINTSVIGTSKIANNTTVGRNTTKVQKSRDLISQVVLVKKDFPWIEGTSADASLLSIDDYALGADNKAKKTNSSSWSLFASGGIHLHNHWKKGQEFSFKNLPSLGILAQKSLGQNVALATGLRYHYRGNMDYLISSTGVDVFMVERHTDYHLRLISGHWIEIPLTLQIQMAKKWMLESGPVAEILIRHHSELDVHTYLPAFDLMSARSHGSDVANQYEHGLPRLTMGWRSGLYYNMNSKLLLGAGFKYVPFADNPRADISVRNNAGMDLFLEMRYRLF